MGLWGVFLITCGGVFFFFFFAGAKALKTSHNFGIELHLKNVARGASSFFFPAPFLRWVHSFPKISITYFDKIFTKKNSAVLSQIWKVFFCSQFFWSEHEFPAVLSETYDDQRKHGTKGWLGITVAKYWDNLLEAIDLRMTWKPEQWMSFDGNASLITHVWSSGLLDNYYVGVRYQWRMELSAQQWTLLLGAQSLVGVEDFPFFLNWLHFLMKY